MIAAMVLGIGLAAASACESSHRQAVASNNLRAVPAADEVSGPESFEGKTGSTVVWGNGQTGCASNTELRGNSMDVKHQLKIAVFAREVARID
jgi:hypothetical protein